MTLLPYPCPGVCDADRVVLGAVGSVFVEREAELGELAEAAGRARTGEPAAVLVLGEAGVGKTRLVAEFAAGLGDEAEVLVGEAVEFDAGGLPYAPFTAVLREVVGRLGVPGVLALLPHGSAGELPRLLPVLGPIPGLDDPDLARGRLFEQVLGLLAALSRARPVVLVVEDLHWADASSRDLLRFLVRSQRAAPGLAVVVTCRPYDLDRDDPARAVLADLDRMPWTRRVELGRLSRAAVATQLRGIFGTSLEPARIDEVFRRSEGNPLLAETLAAIAPDAPLPDSVRDLFATPFRRLPEPSREVVQVAGVGGERVRHALLAELTGLNGSALTEALRPAVTANLLVPDGDGYRFRHALIREVICAELLDAECQDLHVRYAEALERHPELAGPDRIEAVLARHWHAVADRQPDSALLSAWRAADAAFRSLDYAERFEQLGRVLELWERAPDAAGRLGVDRLTVVEEAIVAAGFTRADARALDLADVVLAAPDTDPVRGSQLLVARSMLRHQLGLPGDLRDVREAVQLIPAGHPARPGALDMLARVLLYVPLEEEGRAVLADAAREAPANGDTGVEVRIAASLAFARARAGEDPAGQLAHLDELAVAAAQAGDPLAVGRVARCRTEILLDLGRWTDAADTARAGLNSLRGGQGRGVAHIHSFHLACAYLASGQWDEAIAVVDRSLAGGLGAAAGALLGLPRGTIALARGDLAAAEAAVTEARAAFTWNARYALDFLLLEHLDLELHLETGRDPLPLISDILAADYPPTISRFLWPVIATAARVPDAPVGRLARTLPVVGPVQAAHRLTYQAEIAPAASRQAGWDAAATAWASLNQPYPQALALVRAAESAPAPESTDRLRSAAALATPLGATPLLTRINTLIPGGGPRLGLSPRELQVLRLLTAGHTNRQIAEELFIAVKTADRHVSNILTKLGVGNRVQAATVAHEALGNPT